MYKPQTLLILTTTLVLGAGALNGCDNSVDVQPLETEQVETTPVESSDQVQAPAERTSPSGVASKPLDTDPVNAP